MRFLRVVIAIWLLMVVLIIGAKWYGNATKETNELRETKALKEIGFNVCNGQPCFLGIVPGITTALQAYELISQYVHLDTYYSQGRDIIARVNDIGFTVATDHKTGDILSIQILVNPQSKFPQLDSFIAMYGSPCAVEVYPNSQQVNLQYSNLLLGSQKVQGRLSFHSTLSFVVLTNPKVPIDYCTYTESQRFSIRPWLGFTFANRYNRS